MKQRARRPKARVVPPPTPPEPLSFRRKWLFRIAAMLLPVVALVLLEIVLRMAGYGYDPHFFKTIQVAGKPIVIANETFSLRFFPPELARWPASMAFLKEKPPGVTRIFIFGESAAMGDPQPAFGAGRYLAKLLETRYPRQKFEVINLGITAINSHVILPIARDCAKEQGDIWLIYMGNNEMVGPFGAATVFGSQAAPLTFVRFNLALQTTRFGQLLMTLARKLAGPSRNASWGGMQMFLNNQVPPSDPRRGTVYANFERNLRAIVRTGEEAGAKVVLSTVSVNLKDCPPFASLPDTNLPPSVRSRFDQCFADGKSFAAQTNYLEAARAFEQAASLDPHFAEVQFRWADSLSHLTNATAPGHYQAACDADALPFRADTLINRAIRQLAAGSPHPALSLCDAEQLLAAQSPGGVAGDDSFYEHVHFNFDGNYRLARAWAEQLEPLLPRAIPAATNSAWAAPEICNQALGLTDWNRQFVVQSVLRRLQQPPLSSQFNNDERLKAVQAEDQELRRRQAEPGAAQKARAEFRELIKNSPGDPFLLEGFANFLEAVGDPKEAIGAYRRMIELLPHDFYGSLQLGRLLCEQGSPGLGQPFLEETTRLRPSIPDGWHELGTALAAQEKYPAALTCMLRAEQLQPQDPANVCYTGKVLAKMKRRPEAIERYRRAISMRPGFWEAHFELAGELALDNQVLDAIHEYAETLRLNPRHAVSHANLGVMLVRVNRLDEAIQQFQEAVRLDPNYRAAQDYLRQTLDHRGQKR